MINKKGFTLVELMAVLVILGVVFAIAIPSYNSYTKKARNTLYSSYISNIKDATSTYLEECLRNNKCRELSGNAYTYYTIRGQRIEGIDPDDLNVKIDDNKCKNASISIGFPSELYKKNKPNTTNTKDFYVCLKCNEKGLEINDNECDALENEIVYTGGEIKIKYGESSDFNGSFRQNLYLKYVDIVVTGSKQLEPLKFQNQSTPIKICNNEACDKPFILRYVSNNLL